MSGTLDPAIFEFFANLPQQGPGSDAETGTVLAQLANRLPPRPRVADLGCGTGRSTLVLAERLRSPMTAVDLSAAFCARLRENAAARGLSAIIDVHEADMATPPIAINSLDLLWSEGAAYIIGFAEALARWRPLLRPSGFCVVSECTWLAEDRPEEVSRFWTEAYPAMTTVDGNIARAKAAGYDVEATHILSAGSWDNYYVPIERAILDGRADHLGTDFAARLYQEKAIFEASHGSYGYVFYVMRNAASNDGKGLEV